MKELKLNSVQPDTFIANYMEAMERIETAREYDLFGALWCLSLAASRRTIVDRPRATVYLNLYTIFAAQSGVTRKSTAVREASKVAKVFAELVDTHFEFIESKTTPEALEHQLHQTSREYGYANTGIIISELVDFLGKERYNMHLPGLLTDLYDSPALRAGGGTLSRGPTEVKGVYVNFISASTPTWLVRAINPDVIEGGFTSRCLFVVSETPKGRIAWPTASGDKALHNSLGKQLARIHNQLIAHLDEGEITRVTLDDRAMDMFTSWYNAREHHTDPFRSSFESREDAHVLRLAALIRINNNSTVITPAELQDAINIVSWTKERSSALFMYASNDNLTVGIDRLRILLIEAGLNGIAKARLSKKMSGHLRSREINYALDIMLELDMVQKFEQENQKGPITTIWRATKLMAGEDAIQMVLEQWELLQ